MDDSIELNVDIQVSEKNEENILILTDIVEKGPEFIDKSLDQELYANGETGSEIIELNSTIEDDSKKNSLSNPDLLNISLDSPGMDNDTSTPTEPAHIDNTAGNPEFTDHQLKAVLEKIIEEKFSQRIDAILFQVVEKVVAKEIAEIKKAMAE